MEQQNTNANAAAALFQAMNDMGKEETQAQESAKTEPAKTEPAKSEAQLRQEIENLKKSVSEASADAAKWKRQAKENADKWKSEMDTAKRAQVEREEQEQALRDELETLRKEKRVSDYTARCVALEFDADLAGQTANALADGNMDAVFDCLRAFVEATRTRLNNEALNRQPGLSAGIPPTTQSTSDAEFNNFRRYAGLPIHR